MDAWMLVDYLFSSQMVLTHLVGGGLAYNLIKTNGEPYKSLLRPVVVVELLAFVFWCAIPGGFSTIFTLAVVLYWYEYSVGPKVTIQDNVFFMADEDLSDTVLKGSKLTEITESKAKKSKKYKLSTDLKFIEFYNTKICKCITADVGVIEIDDIAQISEGCYEAVEKAATKKGFKEDRCFHLVLGPGEKTVSLIAPTEEIRNQWISALRSLFRRCIEARQKSWMVGIFTRSDVDRSGMLNFDETILLLNSISRSTDKAYVKEIFNVFSGISGTKNAQGEGTMSVDQFQKFFEVAGKRPEINQVFNKLLTKNEIVLGLPAFKRFLSLEQKETVTDIICNKWIEKTEVICPFYNMSSIGFTNFLLSEEQGIFNRDHRKIHQSMDHPLSHYFIATSHNTYLTKDQLKGKSSVDAYINAFKKGCKCVELDCWDGPNNEPIIYHGHTLTTKILFKDVIQAINDYAFCVSQYPVILSFENHCTIDQQMVMAKYLSKILGDKIYTTPIPDNMTRLPSPNDLQGKIICKTKKLKDSQDPSEDFFDYDTDEDYDEDDDNGNNNKSPSSPLSSPDSPVSPGTPNTPIEEGKKSGSIKSFWKRKKSSKEKQPKIAQELSDLVVFCQAVHFHSFEHSKDHGKFYEMSSFAEKKSMKLCKEEAVAFTQYNQRQFSRIYPAGSRVDSSNYDPVPLWNVGSQLVALNYQTPGRSMQLNQGLFTKNGMCGYVLKPDILRTENPKLDFTKRSGIKVTIKIISGSQLPYTKEATLKNERQLAVQVRISGADIDNKKDRTRLIKNNGYNPMWNDDLHFTVKVPELALVTFSVKEGDNFLAGYTIPFNSIMKGYRRVALQDKASERLPYSSLFVHVAMVDQSMTS